ncbi:MAG: T9SS type A sorting domain-containing protein [Ignavibacteria bacterium]
MFITAQDFQNSSVRWNRDPRMTAIYQEGNYIPLPQNSDLQFSTKERKIMTGTEVFTVSPNFRVHPTIGQQSETPITRDPFNPLIMLASANTWRGGSEFSTGVYVTTDGGMSWSGNDTLNNGGFNHGDPGPVIDKNGTFLMSYITLTGSMGASYSNNKGITWTPTSTFPGATTSADKNFSATDDVPSSSFYGRSYTVYTEFSGTYNNRIVISYSTNGGAAWSAVAPVSPPPSIGHFHMGCDLKVNTSGELCVAWVNCISNGQNSTEDSLGFAKSTDGGVSWILSRNNADNMNGIRNDGSTFLNGIRTNGFARIDIDRTGGPRNNWIYVVTSEKNISPATDIADVILHRSTDGGVTWSTSRVNQDTPGNGKFQYLSAVRVDEDGGVNVVYYDTRNTPTNDSAQIYLSRSYDGGNNWNDILISDHKFKPKTISGLAGGYQGDYIGITSGNGKAWPYWCEDISGTYQAWTASVGIAIYPLNVFDLSSPSSGTTIVTYPNTSTQYNFIWDSSASSASYKWIFGNPTSATRKITLKSDTNTIKITSGKLDSILASLGVAPGDSLTGQWDVWAFKNNAENDSLKAANGPRAITMKRGISPLTTFNLISPAVDTTITTSVFNYSNINFKWSPSGPGVTYKWKFGSPSISNILISLTSNVSGTDSSFTIANYLLDGSLSGLGLNPGDSLVGEWSAWAYNLTDSVKASQNFSIKLKRESKGDVLVIYDSTNANCRVSKDSVTTNLGLLNLTYDLYNRKGLTSTSSVSFRGYRRVLMLGEGSSVMSNTIKDSLKSYLTSGTSLTKSRLIIMSEDVGYHFDRPGSLYFDSAFARSSLGFQFVADRPGVGGKGITGVHINSNLNDSTSGPSPDVIKRSASVPASQTFNLYKFRLFLDSMNAVGRISSGYNVAVMSSDAESLRPASDSPNGLAVKRVLYGLISFVDEIITPVNPINSVSVPEQFSLSQNYPNPFNPVTVISYTLPFSSKVKLRVYNLLGEEVHTLVDQKQNAGSYRVEFAASDLASGIYFYSLEADNFKEVKRMVLLK